MRHIQMIVVLLLSAVTVVYGQGKHGGGTPSPGLSLFRLPPLERAILCTKYHEGWHEEKKHWPYMGWGHRVLPGERFTNDITRAQGDSILRADLMKLCRLFRRFGRDSLLLSEISDNKIESQTQIHGDEEIATVGQENPSASAIQSNENGWNGLLRSVGLDGLGEITGNLGYIMAMLPDILLGAFTGKTQSLRLKDNLLPMASIVAGLFVRNPLLKMLLIGLGGANLLNKAGHEALERKQSEGLTAGNRETEYKRYSDEPLNPRIVNPVLQGCTLVATIDHVPCTVQLSPVVADAYRKGALPLNTLANAVLAQSDRMNQMASQNYDNNRPETIVRTRGIQ